MLNKMVPWPTRAERRAAIRREQANLESARARTAEAARSSRRFQDLAQDALSDNHFTDIVVRGFRREPR